MRRKRFSAVQWTAWMDEFDQSGLSVIAFCRQIGVNQSSFYAWRRKLTREQRSSPADLFVPVVVQANNQVAIEFSCGAVLRVDNHVDSLRPVLETLVQLEVRQA